MKDSLGFFKPKYVEQVFIKAHLVIPTPTFCHERNGITQAEVARHAIELWLNAKTKSPVIEVFEREVFDFQAGSYQSVLLRANNRSSEMRAFFSQFHQNLTDGTRSDLLAAPLSLDAIARKGVVIK